jgi:DNA ligase-1
MYSFPILYGLDKNGKTRMWKASVDMEGETAVATIEYGLVDGKRITTRTEVTSGKNKGKVNETTPLEQCHSETRRKWMDKKEKEQYTTELPTSDSVVAPSFIAPMLAQTFEPVSKKRNDIMFPCSVQPKLDGFRCLLYVKDGNVVAQSRTGAFFQMDHITNPLSAFFQRYPEVVLDGELYTPDIPFEVIAGLIKTKKRTPEKERDVALIHYHVYDTVHPKWTFTERISFIQSHLLSHPMIHIVETLPADSIAAVREKFAEYIKAGFEGIMLRNNASLYQHSRTSDLQKYKEFIDEEFTIIGYEQGEGKDKGTVIWTCETKDGKPFSVRPKGTFAQRQEWFQNGKSYIGKQLTVVFQEWSDAGIPRFPVGKAIRDE